MPIILYDCPRCTGSYVTFDVKSCNELGTTKNTTWQHMYELFSVCRNCKKSTILIVVLSSYEHKNSLKKNEDVMGVKDSLNNVFKIEGFIGLRHNASHSAPDSVPENIKAVFEEAATCISNQCWNAAGAMFRTCVDLATKDMLPKENPKDLTSYQRNKLAPRIEWLFKKKKLPAELKKFANYIREDGNDSVHDGALKEEQARSLLDFTDLLLDRIYAKPAELKKRIKEQKKRKANVIKP